MQYVKLHEIATMAITPDEQSFFIKLGARIAELRKAQGITQIKMAEELNVSQQTINSYEVARRRIPASTLPILANIFNLSIDELLNEKMGQASGKRGPTPKLQQQIEQVTKLPRAKQKFVSEMLDTVIQQAAH
jgi:transcriptional regulator with XRE-family HTH domain